MKTEDEVVYLLKCFTPYDKHHQEHWKSFDALVDEGYIERLRKDDLPENVPMYKQFREYKLTEAGKKRLQDFKTEIKALHIHQATNHEYYISDTGFVIKIVQSTNPSEKHYCRYQIWQHGILYNTSVLYYGGDTAYHLSFKDFWTLIGVQKKPEG